MEKATEEIISVKILNALVDVISLQLDWIRVSKVLSFFFNDHVILGTPSLSHFRERGTPGSCCCRCQVVVSAELIETNCQELLDSLLPLWQHRLLRLNAFMLTAGPHQSLRGPGFQILGTNREDLLLYPT